MKIFRLAQEDQNIQLGDNDTFNNFLKDLRQMNPKIFQDLSVSQSNIERVAAEYSVKAKQFINDIGQYQPLNFKPSFMTVCKISSFSNDLQQNINFEKIKEDYDNLCKLFDNYDSEFTKYLTIYQEQADEVDKRYKTKTMQDQNFILPAIQQYHAQKVKTEENFEKAKSDLELFKKQYDILSSPGPAGKSILELYEEIINLGNQGCNICMQAANSFNTLKLGPLTEYVQDLIRIYSQISNIYKTELTQAYSYIASSYKNVSKDKIINTINLLSNIIPQSYTNLINNAIYALSLGITFGFDYQNSYAKEILKKFLEQDGQSGDGQSGGAKQPNNPPADLSGLVK